MRYDLEILKELFLPLLEEMVPHLSRSTDDTFWATFNNALLGTPDELRLTLAEHKITDTEHYAGQLDSLKAEYIAWLAQYYCTGHTSPAITLLLQKADPAFMEEVAFQKDLLAAMILAGRAAIKNELKLSDEFAGADISDEEISGAFKALHRDAERNELKRQLKQQPDAEEPAAPKPTKRKRIGAIPLLFIQFAAAAAIGTVATVEVVKVYNENKQESPAVKQSSNTPSDKQAGSPVVTDTTRMADALRADSVNAENLYVVLKGNAVDSANNEPLTDVAITMLDNKGKKQSVHSTDGKFEFRLPLHRDFVITGKKEGYHSSRLSLSTMDASDADAGDVIQVPLRFSKEK